MDAFRSDLLQRRFVSEDGMLSLTVEEHDGVLLTTVTRVSTGECLLAYAVSTFTRHRDPASPDSTARLDHLDVELEVPNVGPFYRLYFARKIRSGETHEKEWLTVSEDTPAEEIRIFPEYCSSPFVTDYDWQDGWWYPYSSFRWAES